MRFPVVLHTDDGIRYGVTVPDLPGCFSTGDSFDAALDSIVESIELHIEGLLAEGYNIPVLQPIAQRINNADFLGGIWAVVNVDVLQLEKEIAFA